MPSLDQRPSALQTQTSHHSHGALFSTNAIAYANGPLSIEYLYLHKDKKYFGFDFVSIYAAALYAIGTVLVAQHSFLKRRKNSKRRQEIYRIQTRRLPIRRERGSRGTTSTSRYNKLFKKSPFMHYLYTNTVLYLPHFSLVASDATKLFVALGGNVGERQRAAVD
jgi:hypothetical protein